MLELFRILAIIANFLDYWTTMIGVGKYEFKEVNPIARWLLKYPILMIYVKLVLVTYILANTTKLSAIVLSCIFGLAALINFLQILRIKHKIKQMLKG